MQSVDLPSVCLLGGSFNPPHIGHLRIAIEVSEVLGPEVFLFIPTADPPHKSGRNLLDFDQRAKMLADCLDKLEGFSVSRIEMERPGPSYTVDTLAILARNHPGRRLGFIIGGESLPLLPSWSRWRDITRYADIIVLPRAAHGKDFVDRTVPELWPQARVFETAKPSIPSAWRLDGGGKVLFLSAPSLDISSSLIRERWRQGRSLEFLVPGPVAEFLDKHPEALASRWLDQGKAQPKHAQGPA